MNKEIGIDEIIADSESRMNKTIHAFESELVKIRTGRASIAMIEDIKVDYYGASTPINQLATLSIPETRTILIQPWDISAITYIEKALLQSDLGVTPINDGKIIRLVLPILTEERRKKLVKHCNKLAEDFRVSIRQIRKDINRKIKEIDKEEKLPEDETKKVLKQVQDLTDKFISEINSRFENKEKEILEF